MPKPVIKKATDLKNIQQPRKISYNFKFKNQVLKL